MKFQRFTISSCILDEIKGLSAYDSSTIALGLKELCNVALF
jgi:hypothetical protein